MTGGCGKLHNFAKKAETLQSLQDQLKNGEIDLGRKDRTIAIAKCIGSALLVVAAAAVAFALISTLGVAEGIGAGLFSMPLAASLPLFGITCADASEVFQKPSPEQLTKELERLKDTEFSESDVQNIKNTLQNLQDLENAYNSSAQAAEGRGDSLQKTKLNANASALREARDDLSKMLEALIPSSSGSCESA